MTNEEPGAPFLRVRWAAVLVLATGVALQFIQTTDPRFPLRYFTVDSALACAAVLVADAVVGGASHVWLVRARGAACLGVVMSGLIFATLIAPSSEGGWWQGGADTAVRIATILTHGVAPVVVVADLAVHVYPGRGSRLVEATWWLLWPVGYFAITLALYLVGMPVPYAFLDPSQPLALLGAVLVMLGLFLGVGLLLISVAGRAAPEHGTRAGE